MTIERRYIPKDVSYLLLGDTGLSWSCEDCCMSSSTSNSEGKKNIFRPLGTFLTVMSQASFGNLSRSGYSIHGRSLPLGRRYTFRAKSFAWTFTLMKSSGWLSLTWATTCFMHSLTTAGGGAFYLACIT